MAKKVDREKFRQFVDDLLAAIPITALYTHVTQQSFAMTQSRLKAVNIWRDDTTPSMQEVPGKNILWDFGAPNEKRGGIGRSYNHIDILRLGGLASTYAAAIESCAKFAEKQIPDEFLTEIKHEGSRIEFLNSVWFACKAFRDEMFREPDRYPAIKKFCFERNIPFDKTFWETMDIGIWPDEKTIDTLRKDHLKGSHQDIKTDFPNSSYKSIVFPLHSKSGNLGGFTIRDVTWKRFVKCQIMTGCFYGLKDAMAQNSVYTTEGEMNPLAYAAAMFRRHGVEKFSEFIPAFFATGSVSNSIEHLQGIWESMIYFPDVKEKKNKDDKDTAQIVMDLYNQIQIPVFMVSDWGCENDKFDLDDFIKREIKNPDWEIDLQKLLVSLPRFLYGQIEGKLIVAFNDEVKNGARIGYAQVFAKKIYNGADKKTLMDFYASISQDNVDQEVVDQIDSKIEDEKDGFLTQNNCYWAVSTSPDGERIKTRMSEFIIKPLHALVFQEERKHSAGEFESTKREAKRMVCNLVFAKGTKTEVTFEPEALIDQKEFWKTIARSCIQVRSLCGEKFIDQIFKCATARIATVDEVVQFRVPGPHIKGEGSRREALRPNLFGGTLRTFLSRGYSVVDGEIKSNKLLKIQLETASTFMLGVYSDTDHAEMSKTMWTKLRRIHKPEVIDRLLGFGCCTSIKHIIDPNTQGLVIFLYGLTASFKTSCARLVQNLFSEAYKDEDLHNFNSTKKAAERTVANLGSNLAVIDELKPSAEWNEEGYGSFIHHVYSGVSRSRLGTNSELQGVESFSANLILTGERRLDLESSVEARHLQIRAENMGKGNKELYDFLNSKEMIPKYKCFGARLIAWQHKHIDELVQIYEDRKAGHMKDIEEHQNKNRIASQEAMIDVGFFSFAKFCQESGACSEDEVRSEIQRFFVQTSKDASVQVTRTSEMLSTKKFIDYLRELIQTKTINMAIVKDSGQKASVIYTKNMKSDVLVIKFTKNNQSYYALPSLDLLLKMINQSYGKDRAVTSSIKEDLAQIGWCRMDAKRQIAAQSIPDVGEAEGKKEKKMRVIVIPSNVLEDENDQVNQSDEL